MDLINLVSSGTIRNGSHPISFNLDQSESIPSNLFASGSNRNRFHAISSHLDQSEIALIQSLLIWNNQESISFYLFSSGSLSADTNKRGLM
ncbi:hypothetical protein CDAR_264721 [Caerostris darwini]|uniref:Uncharacterized protein n=1 Tax=Caerostris darwini TaxID=1538125 RepID=A0AAV4NN68_9ARAC|nr:hypothetical protein CDAR_264721 [Caerostris darwini]